MTKAFAGAMLAVMLACSAHADTPPTQEASVEAVAWKRTEIAGARIAIDQHPAWATLQQDGLVYQRFSNEGSVAVRWGPDATVDDALAHVGLGSGGTTRTIESDEPVVVDGGPGRRVRVRVKGPDAVPVGPPFPVPSDPERVYVFVGFEVHGAPVLTAYIAPASELPEYAPLLDHILASVERL